MLEELTVKNFKLFDEAGVTVHPGKITVFIGANGTGKSSLLQMLLLLKQSLQQSHLVLNGPLINIGSFHDVVHLQDFTRAVEIGISASYRDFVLPDSTIPRLPSPASIRYQALLTDSGIIQQTAAIGGDHGETITSSTGRDGLSHEQIIIEGIATITLQPQTAIGHPIVISDSSPLQSVQAQSMYNKVLSLLVRITTLLSHFYFVPAVRGFDNLTYEIGPVQQASDLSAAGDSEKQATLVANLLASSPELAEKIAERLNIILRDGNRLRSRLVQGRIQLETANGRKSINLFNEASGLNQLIALLLQLNTTPHGSVIGIEEPEIQLHPRAQAALCDVFVEVATQEQKQLILTTHSEHILMGLLTAVANGRLQPDDLVVYEFRREGDAARAERLEVNEYGQIAGGLKGFLEVDIDEIGELIEARFQKQRQ